MRTNSRYGANVTVFSALLSLNITFLAAFPVIAYSIDIEKESSKVVATEDADEDILQPMDVDETMEQIVGVTEPETEEVETEPETEEPETDILVEETSLVAEASYYYDVPLDYELQDHVFDVCEASGVDSALIIAMIYYESGCDAYAIGDDGKSFGLMQIQPRWNEERMYELQCWNLLDPYQNITVGVDLVDELMDYGMPTEWVLMAYNGSVEYANYKINRGEVSDYALRILGMIKELG